jgi:hypothetical protein
MRRSAVQSLLLYSTVDLLVQTSLDQLLLILHSFTFLTKQTTLTWRSIVLSILLLLVIPDFSIEIFASNQLDLVVNAPLDDPATLP